MTYTTLISGLNFFEALAFTVGLHGAAATLKTRPDESAVLHGSLPGVSAPRTTPLAGRLPAAFRHDPVLGLKRPSTTLAERPRVPVVIDQVGFDRAQDLSRRYDRFMQDHGDEISDAAWLNLLNEMPGTLLGSPFLYVRLYQAILLRLDRATPMPDFLREFRDCFGAHRELESQMAVAALAHGPTMGDEEFAETLLWIRQELPEDFGFAVNYIAKHNLALTPTQLQGLTRVILDGFGGASNSILHGFAFARVANHPHYGTLEDRKLALATLRNTFAWPSVESFVIALVILANSHTELEKIAPQIVAHLQQKGVELNFSDFAQNRKVYGSGKASTWVWHLVDEVLSPFDTNPVARVA